MTPPTTTTTATSAAITPMLTPRLPVATARWLPVHSPPSHSPVCCAPDDRCGGGAPPPRLAVHSLPSHSLGCAAPAVGGGGAPPPPRPGCGCAWSSSGSG